MIQTQPLHQHWFKLKVSSSPSNYCPRIKISFLFFAEIRGVDISSSAVTTVVITSNTQSFAWEEYGLKLHMQHECLPTDIDQCEITIMVSVAGQYEFPENCHPVSAIIWLRCEPMCTFVKPCNNSRNGPLC